MLRIGCVKYLNARPLIRGWPDPVDFEHPATLCKRLANGELDVALASSFEFLRNPIYRIIDDVSIASDGPVYSVVVAHLGNISDVTEVELDPASATAVALLRCLLAEFGLNARLTPKDKFKKQAQREAPKSATARLLIGDQAIRFRQKHAHELRFWDLGEQWKILIGLPFVYALWLVRPEVVDPKQIADRLRALRYENLTNLEELIEAEKEFDHQFLSCYYRKHLRFSFGEREKEGLRTFAKLCAKHGLLTKRDVALDSV